MMFASFHSMGTVPSYSDMLNTVVMEESHLLEVRWLFSIMLTDYPITVATIYIWGVSKQRDISQQPLVTASSKRVPRITPFLAILCQPAGIPQLQHSTLKVKQEESMKLLIYLAKIMHLLNLSLSLLPDLFLLLST